MISSNCRTSGVRSASGISGRRSAWPDSTNSSARPPGVIEKLPRDVVLFEDETDLLLFPPLRACWARRGEDAEVPLSGANAKRVLFGALNPSNGTRLFLERKKQWKEDFQEFLGLIHQRVPRMAGVAGLGRGQ